MLTVDPPTWNPEPCLHVPNWVILNWITLNWINAVFIGEHLTRFNIFIAHYYEHNQPISGCALVHLHETELV